MLPDHHCWEALDVKLLSKFFILLLGGVHLDQCDAFILQWLRSFRVLGLEPLAVTAPAARPRNGASSLRLTPIW